jgi:small subunit ribosomal protein S20
MLEVSLAHSKSALKRWRQNERHAARNRAVRTAARTAVRKARAAIAEGDREAARAAVLGAASVLDRASRGNVVHKNAVARHKSRLMRRLNTIGAAPAAEPRKARKTSMKTAAKKTAAKPRAAKKTTAK